MRFFIFVSEFSPAKRYQENYSSFVAQLVWVSAWMDPSALLFLLFLLFGLLTCAQEFCLLQLSLRRQFRFEKRVVRLIRSLLDLVFDTVGAAVVAVWGGARLSGVAQALAARLDAQRRGTE